MSNPRIYVASLSDYNAGHLHGCWLDAARDAEDIRADIQAMLAKSTETPAEEWAIHDYDGFGAINLGEGEAIETVAEVAGGIVTHGDAYRAFVEYEDAEWATVERFEDLYAGEWDSEAAFAEDLAAETGEACEDRWPCQYIDWERAARDLFIDDYFSTPAGPGAIYVFRRA